MKNLIILVFISTVILAGCGDGSTPYIDIEAKKSPDASIALDHSALEAIRDHKTPAVRLMEIMQACPTVISCNKYVTPQQLREISRIKAGSSSTVDTATEIAEVRISGDSPIDYQIPAPFAGGSLTANTIMLFPDTGTQE